MDIFHVLSLCTEAKEWSNDLNIVKLAGHQHTTTRDRLKSEQVNKEEFDTFQETWIPLHKQKEIYKIPPNTNWQTPSDLDVYLEGVQITSSVQLTCSYPTYVYERTELRVTISTASPTGGGGE